MHRTNAVIARILRGRGPAVAAVVALGFALALVAGCGLDGTTPPPPPGTTPGHDAGSGPQKIAAPVIDPVVGTVCTATVPLQGTAKPGVSVFATGGASTSGVVTDAHPATGRFCMDVPLRPKQANVLTVRAQDPRLGTSPPARISVTHSTSCTGGTGTNPPPTPEKSKNVAFGASGKSKDTPDKNNMTMATDGKTATFVEVSGGSVVCPWCAYDGWMSVALTKLYQTKEIRIRWRDVKGAGTGFATQYKVLTSNLKDPGDPDLKNGKWTTIATVTAGDGGLDIHDLSSKQPLVQHLALWLEHDDATSWNETFAVAEIELWDVPTKTTPTPPDKKNTCASIGSR